MTRALLVVAMVLSLWPIEAILLFGSDDDPASTSRQSSEAFVGKSRPTAARPELESIASRVHELNEELGDEVFYIGGIAAGPAYLAGEIDEELRGWFSARSDEASKEEKRVARKMIVLVRAMRELTEYPTQGDFRAYNRALKAFNAAIEEKS